ncbi:MAG: leucine-rich repeat domain-containing protein, partial [Lachnospiraceae bacterium]|nr:leucine-rich repeat domain-containing protein [Lachnospiraceae bacterium]
FHPVVMLYYSIYFQDTALVNELKKQDIKISDIRINIITEGANAMNGYWFEYTLLTERLAEEAYLDVMQQLASEFGGKLFHYTGNILEITRERFRDVNVFEFFLAHFKQDKMNKSEIIRSLIDANILDVLSIVEREGWLNMPRRRDEMIAYATERNRTEILAWLLDFKNRTADFAAEQEKAEKKMMRALNSKVSPNTVAALKKIWSYRKQEDGTLIITNYKGTDTKVTVPEKIGKFNVTAVGDGAFAGAYSGYNVMAAFEHLTQHSEITTLILPKTLQSIGRAAFKCMFALKEINIPESVKEIGENAFEKCGSLKSVTIPQGVKIISANTFEKCCLLQNIA